MSDDKDISGAGKDDAESNASLFISSRESRADRVAIRLQEVVKRAGGLAAVATRSGVKTRTLSRLLAGQESKQETLVALAEATGVSLEWLATGRGEPEFRYATIGMHGPLPESRPAGRMTIRVREGGEFAEADASPPTPSDARLLPEDAVQVGSHAVRIQLLEAYEQAGGATELAKRAGLPVRQLVLLGAGETVPAAVARVVGRLVGLDLERQRDSVPLPGASLAAAGRKPDALFASVDMTRMGKALEAAAKAFQERGTTPSWRRLAQVATLLYDAEDEPSATIRAQSATEDDDKD